MLRKGQEGHVRAEKDLLAAAANSGAGAQWIVKLHYSFQVSKPDDQAYHQG
jgi:protein-serine/threonine kinase